MGIAYAWVVSAQQFQTIFAMRCVRLMIADIVRAFKPTPLKDCDHMGSGFIAMASRTCGTAPNAEARFAITQREGHTTSLKSQLVKSTPIVVVVA